MLNIIKQIQDYIAIDPQRASKREAMRKFKVGAETLNRLELEGHFKFSKKRNKVNWFKAAPLTSLTKI